MNNIRSIVIFIAFILIASVFLVYNLEFKEKEKYIPYQITNFNDKIVEELTGEVNWIINWTESDKRTFIVREKIREFEFYHQDLTIHLVAQDEFLKDKQNLTIPKYIAECIKTNNYDWDIICIDDIIYQEVASILNDKYWGKKYLVDFKKVPGFSNSHQSFIFEDTYYSSITGNVFAGPFINGEIYAIWYNSALTRKIGIKIKDFGMTDKDF
ncbi:MAG: hypothetical protein JXB17_05595, partial [Bacteroidales bacterium]|nr:hypothetical protein [Bacteroidales bacterium]